MQPRVLVTGIGLVTPLGLSTSSTWTKLIAGHSAIRETHHHDAIPIRLAARVTHGALPKTPPLLSPCPPFAKFALVAAREALLDAQLLPGDNTTLPYDPYTSGVSIGVGMCHLPDIAITSEHLTRNEYRKVTPFLVPRVLPNTPAGLVSLSYGLQGPILSPATACAAGAHAIADSFHIIRRREASIMLAGGTEAAINPIAVAGFARAKALTSSATSAPFDADRSGFVLGEGAALLVLEDETHAKSRGAKAYAEICGAGMSGDAFHITSPSPDGNGALRAMRSALQCANRDSSEVDYINAHATGTITGDAAERTAIARLLHGKNGNDSRAVVSSTKGATGHLLGAAGAVEAAFSVLAIAEKTVPPTVGLRKLDNDEQVGECGWGDLKRYVPQVSRRRNVCLALNNSFGFGGTNACLAFSEIPDSVIPRSIPTSNNSEVVKQMQQPYEI